MFRKGNFSRLRLMRTERVDCKKPIVCRFAPIHTTLKISYSSREFSVPRSCSRLEALLNIRHSSTCETHRTGSKCSMQGSTRGYSRLEVLECDGTKPNDALLSEAFESNDHDEATALLDRLEQYTDIEQLFQEGLEDAKTKKTGKSRIKIDKSARQKNQRTFFEECFQADVQMFANYIQACLFSGLLTHALNMMEIRTRSVSKSVEMKSGKPLPSSKIALEPQIFDLILSRLASISPNTLINCKFIDDTKEAKPLDVIRKLFNEMKNLHMKPSPSAYASALEAMHKCEGQNVRIALCLQQVEEDGYSLDEVVGTCFPGSKSEKHVRDAILQVAEYNNYNPRLCARDSVCENVEQLPDLVQDLYKTRKYEAGALQLSSFPKIHDNYNNQMELEKDRVLKVQNILNTGKDSSELRLKKLQLSGLLNEWRVSLLKTFQEIKEKEKLRHNCYGDGWEGHYIVASGGKVYPFLCLLPEQEFVEIVINQLCSAISGGEFTTILSYRLGEEVYARFLMRRIKDTGILQRLQAVYKEYSNLFTTKEMQMKYSPRHLWIELEEKHGLTNLEEKLLPWNRYWTLRVGIKLVELMNAVSFTPKHYGSNARYLKTGSIEKVPAVYNSYVLRARRQFGMTIPHPQFRLLLKDALETLTFESEVAPMVVPPRPWCGMTRGGLLMNQVNFMRCNTDLTDEERAEPLLALRRRNLYPIYDSLNILGSVAWIINKPLLDLQIKYFRNSGSKELGIPQPSSQSEPMPDLSSIPESNSETYKKARRKALEVQKQRQEMHALFMEALYKLSIANMYRDKVIWFAHNIDFRGRVYPVSRHLNYMGSDVYRSLFLFAEGRPLGENGLDWLKIHCINLTDFKKHSSVKDRLDYANEVIDKIVKSADNPDADDAWWKTSDKPWQTLATCIEIAAALRSPDHTKFISKLPVHQDGSCNGLQHYAAMGRDILGAQQVNLSPSETPQDVYLGVAEKAEELRKLDAAKGVRIAQIMDGFVRRKVVKQTVMTTVYGVTRYGGMHQIKRQLAYLDDEFPREECARGANYLVDKVFSSITEMFSGARNIQTWLTQLADVISKMGHVVDWTTPLDLLVTQPYYKQNTKFISSPIQRLSVPENLSSSPNRRKQVNGFPPNFVHSLDSTHMMLTALQCHKNGVTFASVHDCFWSHASAIDSMSRICREQFVALHSQPILHNLAEHLKKHIQARDLTPLESRLENLLNNVPGQGDFDLKEVLNSTFFFQLTFCF